MTVTLLWMIHLLACLWLSLPQLLFVVRVRLDGSGLVPVVVFADERVEERDHVLHLGPLLGLVVPALLHDLLVLLLVDTTPVSFKSSLIQEEEREREKWKENVRRGSPGESGASCPRARPARRP